MSSSVLEEFKVEDLINEIKIHKERNDLLMQIRQKLNDQVNRSIENTERLLKITDDRRDLLKERNKEISLLKKRVDALTQSNSGLALIAESLRKEINRLTLEKDMYWSTQAMKS